MVYGLWFMVYGFKTHIPLTINHTQVALRVELSALSVLTELYQRRLCQRENREVE
jgi:hypothetical protein